MEHGPCAAAECRDCPDNGPPQPLLPWPQGHVPQADLPVAVPFTLCQSVNVLELKGLRSYAIRKARVTVSLEFC